MSELFDTLKKANISERKAKSRDAKVSTFVISKIKDANKAKIKDGVEPDITDDLVVAQFRAFIKNANDTINAASGKADDDVIADLVKDVEYAKTYLPPEISEEIIKEDAQKIVDTLEEKNMKAMGKVVSTLRSKYGSQFDGNKVSKVVKELLS